MMKDHLLATPVAFRAIHEEMKEKNSANTAPRRRAGQTVPGDTRPALHLAQGELGHQRPAPKGPILSMKNVFGRKYKNP